MSNTDFDQFKGNVQTDKVRYIADPQLRNIVNVSIALGRPLLVKGEPGTGKTLLAHAIAEALDKRLIIWNIKSTTEAIDGCYMYDTVQRLNDSRFGCEDRNVNNIEDYITLGPLGEAFDSDEQVVLLIDEIDKADIEFPNDLLQELDVMEFYIKETKEFVKAKHRPIVIITSNNEKELPDAFLRRCVFHYIEFPDKDFMTEICNLHYPNLKKNLLDQCLKHFYALRTITKMRKLPSTSELLDWIGVLLKSGITIEELRKGVPFLGVLIKKEKDLEMALSKAKFPV
ncbi:MAG: AAA family ATPase [Candidatus Lokiarchaeota archaeon]|nr:AAA family ATPase [Candidatus Lokiarchaeota archaeon]MBD3341860.1 AAA family ATPase [Candidatus Lokiarchaeota archaeon]